MVEEKVITEGLFLFERILRSSCGKTCGGKEYSFIPTDIYIDGERGGRCLHPFKLYKRKRESKGTLPVVGEERRCPYDWKPFEGGNYFLFTVVLVFSIHLFTT